MERWDWLKEDEGISQRAFRNHLWTQTTVWDLTVERGQGGKGGEIDIPVIA